MGGAIRAIAGMGFFFAFYIFSKYYNWGNWACMLLPPEDGRDPVLLKEAMFCLYVGYTFRCSLLLMFGKGWEAMFIYLPATNLPSDPKLNF